MSDLTEAAAKAVATAKNLTSADIAHVPSRQVSTAVSPGQMIQALIERPDVDIEKLARMFELQERYEENEARKAYYHAVSCFQSEVDPVIGYDSNVDYTTNKGGRTNFDFTSLPKIKRTVTPLLAKYGLTLTWRTGSTETGSPVVTAILSHELGHSESTTLSAPIDASGGKNAIQAVRSAWSYLRRITAESILGIATGYEGDDDDGASAGAPVEQEPEAPAEKPEMPAEAFAAALFKAQARLTSPQQCEAFANKLRTKYTLAENQINAINRSVDLNDNGGNDGK